MNVGRSPRLGWVLVVTLILSLLIAVPVATSLAIGPGTAVVVNTDGDGLNLRAGPSTGAAILTGMPEGATVEVLENSFAADGYEWARVRYDGIEGFAASQYLAGTPASGGPAPVEPVVAPPPSGAVPGAQMIVSGTDGDGVNVRAEPGIQATIVTGIPEGMTVPVVGGPATDADGAVWYQVEAWGITGWAYGAYLTLVETPPQFEGDPGGAIAVEALLYLGTPYLWAGTDPGGFDCSGFSYFIVNKVLDNDFPRAIDEQIAFGSYVDPSELQPGDLVFFQNTYKEGLSHVGIYIGGGQFVNAGSEVDVVGISNLWDEYWGPRYLEARRVH